jgi:peptidoglycan hydrolase-like protein with peptidoglycan-binding domain
LRLSLSGKRVFVAICAVTVLAVVSFAQSTAKGTSQTSHTSTAKKKAVKRSRKLARAKSRGQQKIETSRTQAIQEALIREHYLSGEPTGKFDSNTEKALQKYQADHGWQSKVVPDSRALISLGLGPDHDHLLNPETAMTSSFQPQKAADSETQANSEAKP